MILEVSPVRDKGIPPVTARRGNEHGSWLGVYRRVIEQTFALPHWFRRPRIHWESGDDIHEAFFGLACATICWRRLRNLLDERKGASGGSRTRLGGTC